MMCCVFGVAVVTNLALIVLLLAPRNSKESPFSNAARTCLRWTLPISLILAVLPLSFGAYAVVMLQAAANEAQLALDSVKGPLKDAIPKNMSLVISLIASKVGMGIVGIGLLSALLVVGQAVLSYESIIHRSRQQRVLKQFLMTLIMMLMLAMFLFEIIGGEVLCPVNGRCDYKITGSLNARQIISVLRSCEANGDVLYALAESNIDVDAETVHIQGMIVHLDIDLLSLTINYEDKDPLMDALRRSNVPTEFHTLIAGQLMDATNCKQVGMHGMQAVRMLKEQCYRYAAYAILCFMFNIFVISTSNAIVESIDLLESL